ncbi:Uncharacterised protein [Mycobacteroides abscessus subsp. abscessus]|nr:Uncharacterised protein [Mycobacteroides abscessus subsp. abscessus]
MKALTASIEFTIPIGSLFEVSSTIHSANRSPARVANAMIEANIVVANTVRANALYVSSASLSRA